MNGMAELITAKKYFHQWEDPADPPVVVDALCDPSVPPLPPHISVKQAQAFVSAMRKGDSHRRDVITQSFKEKLLGFLPHR